MATKKAAAKKKAAPKKLGRPTAYTAALAGKIVARLSEGEPLAVICRDKGMPAVRTVSDWKKAHGDFSADFARARDEGHDAIAAQCLEIADDERQDWKLSKKGVVFDESAVARSRLRVEARLKLLAKWDPKRYGEKIAVGGAEDLPPIQSKHELSDDTLAAIAAGALKK